MALLGRKKKVVDAGAEGAENAAEVKATKKTTKTTTKKDVVESKAKKADKKEVKAEAPKASTSYSYRITEKATTAGDQNLFILNILDNKNKIEIKRDLEKNFKVTVLSIRIVNTPLKKVYRAGRFGIKPGVKKAYITLKKGDSIVLP